jgi:hypothetical protein
MPDAVAFPVDQYAFPAPGEQDEADASAQRNQQIQAAFDAQRFQRAQSQGVSRIIANQAAEIAALRARQQQQKT